MKKLFTTLLISLTIITCASAQGRGAIGVRLGGGNGGINYRHELGANNTLDLMAWVYWDSGFSVAALYEWGMPVINNDFKLYYGVGGHLGLYSESFSIGVDGIVGLQYKIPGVPLAFSIDYKPSLNIIPKVHFGWYDFALGIRYVF